MRYYRVLQEVSLRSGKNRDVVMHPIGAVLSDWEVDDYVRSKIAEGDDHYLSLFEPLTDKEALYDRTEKTSREGSRLVDGQWIYPPWPDYVGLSPEELIGRMKDSTDEQNTQTVQYERGGQGRTAIVGFQRGSAEKSSESQGASTAPQALRWAASNPGDAQHAAELEDRLTSLERVVSELQQPHASSEIGPA
jgi:hypothetical protein